MIVDRERVLSALRAQREHIEQRYGVRIIGIVGSVARGEATEESDVDVIAEIIGIPSLFDLSHAEWDLEEAVGLGLPVELVLRKGMRPVFREVHRTRSRSL